MGLIKEHKITEDSREARRRNGRQSRGAATPAGKERSRAANLRHGIYSKERDQALRALGEDPADLAELMAGAYEQWRPANLQQVRLVERVVQLEWRMDRAARRQEHLQAQHIEKVAADRHAKTMQLRYHEQDMVGFLSTAESLAARPDFYATPGFIAQFNRAFGGEMQWRLNKILELLHRLRQPASPEPAGAPLPPEAATDGDWREFLALDEEQGIEDVPRPDLPITEGEERAGLREDLRYLAKQELAAVHTVWDPFFAKYMKPMTLAERDHAVLDVDSQLERIRREEESCSRQFRQLANLLMKLQDRAEKQESEVEGPESEVGKKPSEAGGPESEVQGPESEARGPESEARSPESGAGPQGVRPSAVAEPVAPAAARPDAAADVPWPSWPCLSTGKMPVEQSDRAMAILAMPQHGQDARGTKQNARGTKSATNARKNVGASGDVDENTGGEKTVSGAERQASASKLEDPMAA